MSEQTAALDWTCDRCEVNVSWMAGTVRPEIPVGWAVQDSDVFCLNCRRELAAEAVEIGDEVPRVDHPKLRTQARIEFEIRREPDLPDSRIARACRTSTMAVRKARSRIGSYPEGDRRG